MQIESRSQRNTTQRVVYQVSENSTEFAINTQILCCFCALITTTPEEERQRSQFKPAPAKARTH